MIIGDVLSEVWSQNGGRHVMGGNSSASGLRIGKAEAGDIIPKISFFGGCCIGWWVGWKMESVNPSMITLIIGRGDGTRFKQIISDRESITIEDWKQLLDHGDHAIDAPVPKPRRDLCPKCGDEGEWCQMAVRCRNGHGVFLGSV